MSRFDDPQLNRELLHRLERDYGLKPKGSAKWMGGGKCPACDKKSLFGAADRPRVVRCGRENKCGQEWHVKELYPDLFENWSVRYEKTPAAPNAAADAYLREARGFDLSKIAGWYVQESYYDGAKKMGSATVRFALGGDVWWERIIDQPGRFGDRKATFRGSYKGMWWAPPTATAQDADAPVELWIVEGIFDAIALHHEGIPAVAAMSCNNYPEDALAGLATRCEANGAERPVLVWALDGDPAGRRYARQWAKKAREAGWEVKAAVIPFRGKAKLDWNDMFQRGRLTKKDIEEYRYQGDLLLAASAQEKASLIYRRRGGHSFPFEFDHRLFWFKVDLEKLAKAQDDLSKFNEHMTKEEIRDKAMLEAGLVSEIANCYPRALYFQENRLTDEQWYYFRIDFPSDQPSVKRAFTPAQVTSASEFKKRMASAPGASFTGTAGQLDALFKRWAEGVPVVQTIDYVGYAAEHKAWVFNAVAVREGRTYSLNDEDYFDLGRLSIKTLALSPQLEINTDAESWNTGWRDLLWECFHANGIVALAYWLGALFAEQIRAEYESYPFLELTGEPGAGKTTLLEFLWRLVGRRKHEGFDPAKATIAARARNFAQVANLPVVLIESDRSEKEDRIKQRAFDWDELKPLYNGGAIFSRGVKNGGNDTYEPNFKAALVIAQNAKVQASPAMMERLLYVNFDKAAHTDEGQVAAEKLAHTPVEELSHFLVKATTAEKAVLAKMRDTFKAHSARLAGLPVRNRRIVKNHAQLAALVDALGVVVELTKDQREQTQAAIEDMALERAASTSSDHPLVEEFWEAYEFLNGDVTLNHARDEGLIAINLNHFIQLATEKRQQLPEIRELKRVLASSKEREFVSYKPVNSRLYPEHFKTATAKCWVFKADSPPSNRNP